MRKNNNSLKENILFLKSVEKRLAQARVVSAVTEAEMLVRHFASANRLDYFTGRNSLSRSAKKNIDKAVTRRLKGLPLNYILKETEFCGIRFFVSKDVLVPRPETELLVEETLNILNRRSSATKASADNSQKAAILDIGTGSGCVAVSLTLARPDCRMTALDVSSRALKIARKNIKYHRLEKKITCLKSDLFSAVGRIRLLCGGSASENQKWDVIVSNPPYVAQEDFSSLSREVLSEPRLALDGGPKGLKIIEKILDQAPRFLNKNGWLLMEIGKGQSKILTKKISREKVFKNLRFVKDYNGIERILVGQASH